ncbi:ABC transporter permease [Streptomyces naphthomycinicus]|uniref:ABC transporter permease n=1 Tax=Streptomyces naphthomycinicus TaxID=2872625 RepID=UPI001CECD63E|nr:ABC transporter permease [Streptomyces sp. TML10]
MTALSPALRSEWVKIRSLRGTASALIAVFALTLVISVLVFATIGRSEADSPDYDPVFMAFYALNFAQVAAIYFGTAAFSSEYRNGALQVSLAAVPNRDRFYLAKMTSIGVPVLVVGLVTSFTAFLTSQAFMGEYAIGLGEPGALRACVGAGIYLALMALFAAGLTAVLRSGLIALSIIIPFMLVVSFVVGDLSAGIAEYLPDRAGQQVLRQHATGSLGPWGGLAVTAAWAAAAQLAGWWCVRRRDA